METTFLSALQIRNYAKNVRIVTTTLRKETICTLFVKVIKIPYTFTSALRVDAG